MCYCCTGCRNSFWKYFTIIFYLQSLLIENNWYICPVFNIITRRTLLEYCKKYPVAATALFEWYHELVIADYKNFNELKMDYPNASLVGDDRVVFNIMGNKFRLVIRIVFEFKSIQIKWFGNHTEYDSVNVETIQYKKK